MTPMPDDAAEWIRLANAMLGIAAFGLLVYRLFGRWDLMSWLSRVVVILLAVAVLTMALGAARAEQIDAPFNELALMALVVNVGTVVVGLVWHRWLDPSRRRT